MISGKGGNSADTCIAFKAAFSNIEGAVDFLRASIFFEFDCKIGQRAIRDRHANGKAVELAVQVW